MMGDLYITSTLAGCLVHLSFLLLKIPKASNFIAALGHQFCVLKLSQVILLND